MLDRQQITDMGKWAGFVGIFTLIGGILSCISIVGIIPGVIAIILGLKLRNVKQYAEEAAAGFDEESQINRLNFMVSDLAGYFKIQGILMIIGIALAVVGIVIMIAVFAFSFMNAFDPSYRF